MADFSKFRSSLNGFNRSDVADYIEALCAEHQKSLKGAQEEAASLSQQLAQAQESLDVQTARSSALQTELEATQTALESTQAALEEALTALTEPEPPAEDEPAESPEETPEKAPDYPSLELEAYRRAEAMERSSTQRAARLRAQLDDLLDQVSSRYEQTGQEIQVLTEDIRTNLKRLEDTLSDLDAIFDEASESFNVMETEEYPAEQPEFIEV